MMWLTLEMRASVRCRRCNIRGPLAGLRQKATCGGCTAPLDIIALHANSREGGVRYCFGAYYDGVAEALIYGDDHEIEGANEGAVILRRKPPACACGAQLPAPEPGVRSLACPACHDSVPVRWPDAATQLWDPRLWCVIGDAGEVASPVKEPMMSGTVVSCGNCGGGLVQQGRRRALICAHCNAPNFLSDTVWTKLFPLAEDHPFYLVYRLDDESLERMYTRLDGGEHYFFEDAEEALIKQRLEEVRERCTLVRRQRALAGGPITLETARELADWAALPEADAARIDARLDPAMRHELEKGQIALGLLTAWARSSSPLSRASAARTVPAGSPLLAELARDPSGEVRLALAGRTTSPPELIAALRKDPDAAVAAAAKANPSFQPGFFTRVFGG
jgi:hypothetical protein